MVVLTAAWMAVNLAALMELSRVAQKAVMTAVR